MTALKQTLSAWLFGRLPSLIARQFVETRPVWEMSLGGFLAVLLALAAQNLTWLALHVPQKV
jgi:hypothetical protein